VPTRTVGKDQIVNTLQALKLGCTGTAERVAVQSPD